MSFTRSFKFVRCVRSCKIDLGNIRVSLYLVIFSKYKKFINKRIKGQIPIMDC